jgi:hypothetical protein
MNYYSHFYKSALHQLYDHIDQKLVRWAQCKCRKFEGKPTRAREWPKKVVSRQPPTVRSLAAPWESRGTDNGSRVTCECPRTVLRGALGETPEVYSLHGATSVDVCRWRAWQMYAGSGGSVSARGNNAIQPSSVNGCPRLAPNRATEWRSVCSARSYRARGPWSSIRVHGDLRSKFDRDFRTISVPVGKSGRGLR